MNKFTDNEQEDFWILNNREEYKKAWESNIYELNVALLLIKHPKENKMWIENFLEYINERLSEIPPCGMYIERETQEYLKTIIRMLNYWKDK